MPEFRNIITERHGRVFVVRINRPEAMNAIDTETNVELNSAWGEFRDDPELWVGVLTGAGDRSFSAGQDLKLLSGVGLDGAIEQNTLPFGGITDGPDIWKPLVAAINGFALGGGLEMALACDLRIAATHCELGLPEVRWGLIAGAGGLVRLPRAIPMAIAMEMVLMGRRLTADEALQCRLVNAVVPPERLMPTALEWAQKICEMGPLAIRASKEVMLRSLDLPLHDGVALSMDLIRYLAGTHDAAEGPRAFAEKRKPDFQGR